MKCKRARNGKLILKETRGEINRCQDRKEGRKETREDRRPKRWEKQKGKLGRRKQEIRRQELNRSMLIKESREVLDKKEPDNNGSWRRKKKVQKQLRRRGKEDQDEKERGID